MPFRSAFRGRELRAQSVIESTRYRTGQYEKLNDSLSVGKDSRVLRQARERSSKMLTLGLCSLGTMKRFLLQPLTPWFPITSKESGGYPLGRGDTFLDILI